MSGTTTQKEVSTSDVSAPTHDEIIALEESYWDAMKAKDGGRTTELSGNTSLVTGARGVMSIAKDKMGTMTEAGDWKPHSYEFDDVLCRG